jgi:ligand-binding sensor domain-containing protein
LFAAVLLATGVPAALRAADADHADKLPESWAIDFWREPQGLPHARVRAVTQTRDGYIWLGTGRGLARFDGVRFTLFDSRNSALKENEILALKEDRDGGLWAGTAGGGATLLKDGRFSTYSIANGLADDFVRQITEDSKGGIWIATNHGVSRITNGVIRSFSSKDGLADDVVRQIEEDPAGNVWVATDRGVSRFSDERRAVVRPGEPHLRRLAGRGRRDRGRPAVSVFW